MSDAHRDEIAKLEALYAENPEGRIFTHLAEAYRKAGELERAHEVLAKGLERHPDYSSAHVVLGRVLQDQGRSDEADVEFQRVLEFDGQNLVALRSLGQIARDQGRDGAAIEYYERLLDLDPSSEETREALAELRGEKPPAEDATAGAGSWTGEPPSDTEPAAPADEVVEGLEPTAAEPAVEAGSPEALEGFEETAADAVEEPPEAGEEDFGGFEDAPWATSAEDEGVEEEEIEWLTGPLADRDDTGWEEPEEPLPGSDAEPLPGSDAEPLPGSDAEPLDDGAAAWAPGPEPEEVAEPEPEGAPGTTWDADAAEPAEAGEAGEAVPGPEDETPEESAPYEPWAGPYASDEEQALEPGVEEPSEEEPSEEEPVEAPIEEEPWSAEPAEPATEESAEEPPEEPAGTPSIEEPWIPEPRAEEAAFDQAAAEPSADEPWAASPSEAPDEPDELDERDELDEEPTPEPVEEPAEEPWAEAPVGEEEPWVSSEAGPEPESEAGAGPAVPPDEPSVLTETFAHVYARQGLYERAAEVYRELVRNRPDDEALQARLAEMERLAAREAPAGPAADPEAVEPVEGLEPGEVEAGDAGGELLEGFEPEELEAGTGFVVGATAADAEVEPVQDAVEVRDVPEPPEETTWTHDEAAGEGSEAEEVPAEESPWTASDWSHPAEDTPYAWTEDESEADTSPPIRDYLAGLLSWAGPGGERPSSDEAPTGDAAADEADAVATDVETPAEEPTQEWAGEPGAPGVVESESATGDTPASPDEAARVEEAEEPDAPGVAERADEDDADDDDLDMFRSWLESLKQ